MYKSFRVKNFRCFKDLQINDLGRVNLIAGKNNTGKTALMEAMYIHSGNRDLKTLLREEARHYRRDMMQDANAHVIRVWKTIFANFNTTEPVIFTAEIETNQPSLLAEMATRRVQLSVVDQARDDYVALLNGFRLPDIDMYKDADLMEFQSDYDKPSHLLSLSGSITPSRVVKKHLFKAQFLRANEWLSSRNFASRFSVEFFETNGAEHLTRSLSNLEPRLKDLALLYDELTPKVFVNLGLTQPLPFDSMGDGMKRVAAFVVSMNDLEDGIIFIDEIENGIHHSVQKDVWKAIGQMARELDIQIFATTHSYEMIEAAHEAFRDDDPYEFRFHRLNRNSETGQIEAVTYNKAGVNAFTNINYEVRG